MHSSSLPKWEQLQLQAHRLQLMGEFAQAERCYQEALAENPGFAPARLACAQLVMQRSEFREGREQYEARLDARGPEDGPDWRQLPIARWRGENLAGKSLYLWAEQGFGDAIMFGSFLPYILAMRPKQVALGIFPKMRSLFARSFPQVSVESLQDACDHALLPTILELFPAIAALAAQNGLPDTELQPLRQAYDQALHYRQFDYAAPMGDLMVYGLPGFLPSERQTSFLVADPKRLADMQPRGPDKRIGISWHTTNANNGGLRSVPLAHWLPILRLPGYRFFSLQHHVPNEEIERFCAEHGCAIHLPPFDPVQDTEGLAALVAGMDEVISIDNSNAHLAGALGIPAALLLPKGCDFRWTARAHGPDTLWYQSLRVLRQEEALRWEPVIARAAARLIG